MQNDWKDAFWKAVAPDNVGLGLPDALKQKVLEQAQGWLGEDRPQIAALLRSVLADGRLDKSDASALVSALVSRWSATSPFGHSFTQKLLATLDGGSNDDGELTLKEVAAAAAGWLSQQTDNQNLKQFIAEIADGALSVDQARDMLLAFVKDKLGEAKYGALAALLDGKVLLADVLLLVTALRQADAPANPGSTLQDHLKTLLGYLQGSSTPALDKALQQVIEGRHAPLAAAALAAVMKGDDVTTLFNKQLAQRLRTRLESALTDQLRQHIVGINDAQATALAQAIRALWSGEHKLWAEQTDEEEFIAAGLTKRQYPTWVRVRQVLYAVGESLRGGSVVPTDALARPHVFAAARIKTNTPLNSLMAGAGQEDALVRRIKWFCAAEFSGERGGGTLADPHNYPVDVPSVKNSATARKVLQYVDTAIVLGDAV